VAGGQSQRRQTVRSQIVAKLLTSNTLINNKPGAICVSNKLVLLSKFAYITKQQIGSKNRAKF